MCNRVQRCTGTRACRAAEGRRTRYERLAWKLHDLERGIAHAEARLVRGALGSGGRKAMRTFIAAAIVAVGLAFASDPPPSSEAPAGFDDKGNGMVDDSTHQADKEKFDEAETVDDGLGPLYNAQACRECHQNPTSGGASQITA